MNLLLTPTPIPAAVAKLDSRDIVPSTLRTKEWATLPLAIRDRSFFSAGVYDANFLQQAKDKLSSALALRRETVANGTAFVDRSSFIGDMRKLAIGRGLGVGTDPKSLTDLASRARLGLVYDMQTNFATGYARWQTDQNYDLLNAYPAQELLPSTAKIPRLDWERRWIQAGGRVIDGRIVGLKTDPAWQRLSNFGLPYPPFDFGSQRELIDLDRAEAETLGLLSPSQNLQPQTRAFNDDLEASLQNLAPAIVDLLKSLFGPKLQIQGTTAKFSPSPVPAAAKAVDLPVPAAAKAVDLPVPAAAKAVDLPVAAAAKAVESV